MYNIRRLIQNAESLVIRMRWAAFFFLNPDSRSSMKETYGFRSKKPLPQITAMQGFEQGLADMIRSVKFRHVYNTFQDKLSSDIKLKITNSDSIIVPADKSSNFYKMDKESYDRLLTNKITKTYKKISPLSLVRTKPWLNKWNLKTESL